MENNNQVPKEQEEIKISKKSFYIGGGVLGFLVLAIAGYFIFGNKNKAENTPPKLDSLAVKSDSALVKKDSLKTEEYEEGYEPYGEYVIVANTLSLPNGQKLNFGDKVYVDFEKSTETNKVIYLNNPAEVPSAKNSPISVNDDVIIDNYSFDDFKKYFLSAPYSTLPAGVKKLLLGQNKTYKDNKVYELTQNAQRAKSTLAVGDFDGDGSKDYAVALDENEYGQQSRLVIISINKATKSAYLAFASNFSDRVKIKSFVKGASVYMDSENFVKAPQDGILLANEYGSVAIIYDANAQKYKVYDQSPTASSEAYVEE